MVLNYRDAIKVFFNMASILACLGCSWMSVCLRVNGESGADSYCVGISSRHAAESVVATINKLGSSWSELPSSSP